MNNTNAYIQPDFLKHINKEHINIILELGAFDGLYTEDLYHVYAPKKIYSIEANPDKEFIIKHNQQHIPNIDFTSVLLSDTNTLTEFYAFKDDGASSSIFEHPDGFTEKKILNAMTLDTFCDVKNITNIDLICADVEGAETKIFSQQKIMHTVKYIISEVKIEQNFKGTDFPGIDSLTRALSEFGFKMVEFICTPGFPFGDSLWIKQ